MHRISPAAYRVHNSLNVLKITALLSLVVFFNTLLSPSQVFREDELTMADSFLCTILNSITTHLFHWTYSNISKYKQEHTAFIKLYVLKWHIIITVLIMTMRLGFI